MKRITVGYDLTWMNVQNTSGGVFQYAQRLATRMAQETDLDVIAIIGSTGVRIFDHLAKRKNFKLVLADSSSSFIDAIRAHEVDVVHSPVQLLHHVAVSVPMISSLHDMQHIHFPDFFTREELVFREHQYKASAEFSERLIVSYEHVKRDIVKVYGVPAAKIDVCPLGFKRIEPPGHAREPKGGAMPGVSGGYLLYPANTWRHKNHLGLIRALKRIQEKHGVELKLICTGTKYDDFYPEIESLVRQLGLAHLVTFTGYVPEEEFLAILTGATLVVIPTLYEAGSFPLLEAMANDVPVICSNVTSLPETIGDPEFTFDPANPDEIADKIVRMLNDPEMRARNLQNSRSRMQTRLVAGDIQSFKSSYQRGVENYRGVKKDGQFLPHVLEFERMVNSRTTDLEKALTTAEVDRADRLAVIRDYDRQLKEIIDDRDRWQKLYNETLENREYFKSAYETMEQDRDRWQKLYNETLANRDYFKAAYEKIVEDRDRWQRLYNEVLQNRDYFKSAYEKMVADRDRWQQSYNEMQRDRDYFKKEYEALVLERDRATAELTSTRADRDEYRLQLQFLSDKLDGVLRALSVSTQAKRDLLQNPLVYLREMMRSLRRHDKLNE